VVRLGVRCLRQAHNIAEFADVARIRYLSAIDQIPFLRLHICPQLQVHSIDLCDAQLRHCWVLDHLHRVAVGRYRLVIGVGLLVCHRVTAAGKLWLVLNHLLLNLVWHVIRRERQLRVALVFLGRLVTQLLADGRVLVSRLVLSLFFNALYVFDCPLHVAVYTSRSSGHVKSLWRLIVWIIVSLVVWHINNFSWQAVNNIVVGVVVILNSAFANCRSHVSVLLSHLQHLAAVALFILTADQVKSCA
jgi:hypothetical protein